MHPAYKYVFYCYISIPFLVVLIRASCSAQFLYPCSASASPARIALDVFAYLAAVLPCFPWASMADEQFNVPAAERSLQRSKTATKNWQILLSLSLIFNVAAAVMLGVIRWHGLGKFASGCEHCPAHADTLPRNWDCGTLGSDFFYNADNYCKDALEQQCFSTNGTATGDSRPVQLPDLSQCPVYGCNLKLLPLQSILFYMLFSVLIANVVVLVAPLMSYVSSAQVGDVASLYRLPAPPKVSAAPAQRPATESNNQSTRKPERRRPASPSAPPAPQALPVGDDERIEGPVKDATAALFRKGPLPKLSLMRRNPHKNRGYDRLHNDV